MTRLSSSSLSLERSLNRLKQVEDELRAHLGRALHEERLITRYAFFFPVYASGIHVWR
jgi:hypothetical protein